VKTERRMRRGVGLLAAAVLALAAGCSEAPDVTLHEPGAYKGPKDPLTTEQAAAREEELRKRFQLVQTDR